MCLGASFPGPVVIVNRQLGDVLLQILLKLLKHHGRNFLLPLKVIFGCLQLAPQT